MVVRHHLFIQDREFPDIVSAKYTANYNRPAKLEIQLAFYDELIDTDFKVGDKVLFMRGYDGNCVNRFVGYIDSVSETPPFTVTCYDKLHFLRKEDIPNETFSGKTGKEILSMIFVDDGGQGGYNSDLRTITLDFKFNTQIPYSQIPANASKKAILSALTVNEDWQYYMDFNNTLVVEKPYTRNHNIDMVTENDTIAKTYNIREVIHEPVKVKVYSVNSKTMIITSHEGCSKNILNGFKLVEKAYKDLDAVQLSEKAKNIVEEHSKHNIDGNFCITGLVGNDVCAVNVGQKLKLNYFGDEKDIYVEAVEETLSYKDKIKQKIFLKSTVG